MEQQKKKMPVWAIVLIVIVVIGVIANFGDSNNNDSNNKFEENKKATVTIINFDSMTKAEIDNWCNTNKINCTITDEYSNNVEKGKFISQSVDNNKTIYEGETISIKFSLGKEPTTEQKNALKKAESYSKTMHLSKQGIYKQLTSSIEGFAKEDAQYAIDNIQANWKENALQKAKSYQSNMNMSKNAIYNQLTSNVEGFTKEEAQYAIDNLEN